MTTPDQHERYNKSPKGRLRTRRYDVNRPKRTHRTPAMSAEAQRDRRARPEYVLARNLGVGVKVARAILESGGTT